MRTIDNYIVDQLWRIKSLSYLLQVQKNYPDITLYIFGGVMRDIYNSYYNKTTEINDVDVFIDQRKMPGLDIKSLEPQIKLDNIDFFTTNNNFLKIESSNTILDYCNSADFSINSCYYNLKNGEVKYNHRFLSDIKNKVIRLLFEGNSCKNNLDGNIKLFCSYIKLRDKLGFKAENLTELTFDLNYKKYLKKSKRILDYCNFKNYSSELTQNIIHEIYTKDE